ncbi:MAG: MmcQ/YjbR family DNA-binding protein [Gemmataceae bacterium]
MAKRTALDRAEMALRGFAMTYPASTEDFPWGHRAIKVRGKLFVIFANDNGTLRVTAKLPVSNAHALALPFAEPTGYGLGKSGWVTATFGPKDTVPLEMLFEWVDESYRAVAPKKLVATLQDGG